MACSERVGEFGPSIQVPPFSVRSLEVEMLEIEDCTGFKLKPEPGPYPRSSDPTRVAQFNLKPEPIRNLYFFFTTNSLFFFKKKRERCCISRLHAMISKQIHVKKQIHQGSASSQGLTAGSYHLTLCTRSR